MANKKISQVYVDAPAAPLLGTEIMIGVRSGANVGFTSSDLLTYINANIGTIPVSKGGTGLTTIAAKSILVANVADTFVALTPSAGQSIRRNAGDTAWEAYTPSSGISGLTTNRIPYATSSTTLGDSEIINNSGSIGVGTASADRKFHVEQETAATNAVTYLNRLTSLSSGTPANGIGVGIEFEVETASSNNEVGATIEVAATDVTSTSEDFDIIFKTMTNGAAASERFRFATAANRLSVTGDIVATGSLIAPNGMSGGGLTSTINDGSNSTVTNLFDFIHTTSGTPANGIGVGGRFQVETSSGNTEVGATIECVTTDVTLGSEDFDLVFKTMVAGASATEHLRFGSNKIGFLGSTSVVKQTSGANLTNNVTSGGTDDTIANFTDLTIYANDAATIRNDIYQLSRKLKQVNDALRAYGLLT